MGLDSGCRAARVAVIGDGSIGSIVSAELTAGTVDGAQLCAVVVRTPRTVEDTLVEYTTSIAEAVEVSDIVIECAGQDAVRDHAVDIVEAGRDLIITSVGALVDMGLRRRLYEAGPGRVVITNGAVGGLDIISAAERSGGLDEVALRSVKRPHSLLRPWMSAREQTRLASATEPIVVFSGAPSEAAQRFPESLNVAVALDFAAGARDVARVELIADPSAEFTRHEITATGSVGQYHLVMENRPSPDNPKTSAVVPYSILSSLATLVGRRPMIA